MKKVNFVGDSLDNLRNFPNQIKKDLGYQIDQVQNQLDPLGSKAMTTVGSGVRQLSAQDASGWYRVIYYAKIKETVHILHCFNKKTNTTSQTDIDLAKRRYKDIVR